MKKIRIYTCGLILGLGLFASCDQGFDELNVNPIQATELNPAHLLNNAIIRSSYPGQTLVFDMAIVQHMVSPNGGVLAGGNFNQENRTVSWGLWQRHYREVLKHTVDVLNFTRQNPARANLYHMARIWQADSVMVLTDSYGDIPYTQAGLGYIDGNISPAYDTQESIYTDLLKEIDEATAALDPAGSRETSEVLYGGDIAKWKRFGNSLLLRAAMRLVRANPTLAQNYASKAIAGGLMESNADNAVIRHTELYTNDIGNTLNGTERANFYLTAPFVDYLKNNNDPRLGAIAARYVGAKSGADQDNTPANQVNRNPADQIGMPMGYNNGTIIPIYEAAGLGSFYEYSQLDRTRLGNRFAPVFVVTSAQTKLLQAEAIVRGWAQGDANAIFASAVSDHMQQLGQYGASSAIAPEAITAYVQANPLAAGSELAQINSEYWVASFLNGPEAFANFRRSGYPTLPPNPYPGRDITGDFIRRLNYSDDERSVNSDNLQQAINRQGPDTMDTRVWWDKQQ